MRQPGGVEGGGGGEDTKTFKNILNTVYIPFQIPSSILYETLIILIRNNTKSYEKLEC